jgi:4-oxalomesaconate hydratase
MTKSLIKPVNSSTQLLVISAHAADFVWRAGGAIATVAQSGGTAKVIALSYGERGESGELWKEPDQTEEKVKAIRRAEAEEAAGILGATFEAMDLGDYPLELDRAAMERLTGALRDFEPSVILTHAKEDPFNPDHGVAYSATERARQLASGAGVASAFKTIKPPALLLFEPHQPELCGFYPNTFLDITPVFDKKRAAMEVMGAQGYLREYYSQRASQRANHARRICGDKDIRFAEAFQRVTPTVIKGF